MEFNIKDLQNVELGILLEVDRLCRKHGIKYFLVSGTLLGAIRHKGFIPWDDDIDISMPIKDYYRFCKIAKKELSKEYFLQNYKTDVTGMWFAKVRKNDTTAIECGYDTKLIHQGVWIDIFPMIGVKNDSKWLKKINMKVSLAKTILNKKIGLLESTENKALYVVLNKLISLKVCRFFSNILCYSSFKNFDKYDHCFCLWPASKIKAKFDKELFVELCEVEFEGHLFPAPKKWHEFLTILYGEYMIPPPPEKRNGGCHTLQVVDLNNSYQRYIRTK